MVRGHHNIRNYRKVENHRMKRLSCNCALPYLTVSRVKGNNKKGHVGSVVTPSCYLHIVKYVAQGTSEQTDSILLLSIPTKAGCCQSEEDLVPWVA